MLSVQTAISRANSERQVASELAAVAQSGDAVTLMFCSPHYDHGLLCAEVAKKFGPRPVFGCTTAGEISSEGFSTGGAVAISLQAPGLRVGCGIAEGLLGSPFSAGREAARQAAAALGLEPGEVHSDRHVAVSLIDGRSGKEESFIAGAASAVPSIGLVGGSASDEQGGPPRTRVFAGGRAIESSALLLIFEPCVPFSVVVSEHMVPTDKRVVVTDSDPASRTVFELNGRPALEVYEELLGERVDDQLAGRSPFARQLAGRWYIRSILEVCGSALRFACAVESGVVLRLVEPGDLIGTTESALTEAAAEVGGDIRALLAFNCLGRFLEVEARGETAELARVMTRYPMVGFNTFGEQAGALHVNHTLTALALGGGDG